MNTTIQKSKKYLDNFVSQNIIVKQHGFIESYFEIKDFEYNIEFENFKFFGKDNKNFIKVNLNQIYNMIYRKEKIELHLDNDTILLLETKR